MDIQKKLGVLEKVAAKLNSHGVTWAIGASLLLYLKGKVTEFQDIDLMVMEEDVEQLKSLLQPMGQLQAPNPDAQYKTKHFLEFVIDQVDVDVIAGFVIVHDGKDYSFPLQKEDIAEYITVNSQQIPLQSLAQWRSFYELMGRTEKVKIIDTV